MAKEELYRLEHLDADRKGSLRLQDFSMELYKGEVLGILSKNSTETDCLLEVLQGLRAPLRGRISYCGKPLNSERPPHPVPLAVIHRHSRLIGNFSVADNIFVMRRGFKKLVINSRVLEEQAGAMLKKWGVAIRPESCVKDLSTLEKVIVEIAKSRILRIPVVVLQGLAGFLSDQELAMLHPCIKAFRKAGATFLIIDSTGSLLRDYGTRIILLDKGRNRWTFRQGEFSDQAIARFFKLDQAPWVPETPALPQNEEVLRFRRLSAGPLRNLDLCLRRGEILGLLDLEGDRIEALKAVLLGETAQSSGEILAGKTVLRKVGPLSLIRRKIGIVREDPSRTLLFPQLSALDNLTFCAEGKIPFFRLNRRYSRHIARRYAPYLSPGGLKRFPDKLSPRELHSLAYLKWHLYAPDGLILIKPFSSVDRRMDELTISLMELLRNRGIGLLILTSNLWELSAVSRKLPVKIQRLSPPT